MYMHLLAEVRNACRATLHVRQHPTRFPCTNPNVRRCPSAAGAACDAILDPASPGAGGRGLAESTIDSAVYRQHDVDQESSDPAQERLDRSPRRCRPPGTLVAACSSWRTGASARHASLGTGAKTAPVQAG